MGLFERLGETVERFKQEAVSARDESADYRCRNCDTEIYSERERCPECGSTEIERVTDVEAETTENRETTETTETVETAEETTAVEETGTADGTVETEDAENDVGLEAAEAAEKTEE